MPGTKRQGGRFCRTISAATDNEATYISSLASASVPLDAESKIDTLKCQDWERRSFNKLAILACVDSTERNWK